MTATLRLIGLVTLLSLTAGVLIAILAATGFVR